ncbi:glycosyltransferase family protein [Bacillus sp. JJ1764]|uniref:glycosyltransferase family protein n=1 Tax=Bacillus sp. JJ1764 TaxID=3122964 RepID=UPI0030000DC7
MKIGAIIQARMGSTRLPGKVLKTVLNKPLLEYQIERVKRAHLLDEIIVATTTSGKDQPIVDLCGGLSIPVFRGSEEDVLSRYLHAANEYSIDVIVRLTSDCPLIDPDIINRTIDLFLKGDFDYTANIVKRTYPRGLDVEVFSKETLTKMNKLAGSKWYREHVTTYIYDHLADFKIGSLEGDEDWGLLRWTVDTQEDFCLIENLLTALYPVNPAFLMNDVLQLLKIHPEWLSINSLIQQKGRTLEEDIEK